MNKDEIIKLILEYFVEGGIRDDGSCSEYYATQENIIAFAEALYEEGYDQGCYEATGGQ